MIRFVKQYWPSIIAGFFVLYALYHVNVYGFNLPGMAKDQTLRQRMERAQESDIESPRDGSRGRPASIDKRPWLSDNLHEMENLVWPEFGRRSSYDWHLTPPNWDGTREWPGFGGGSYCLFYQPNKMTDCESSYSVHMGIIHSVVTDMKVTGKYLKKWNPVGQPFGAFIEVWAFEDAAYGSEILVEAWTASVDPRTGEKSEGYCKTTILIECEECPYGETTEPWVEYTLAGNWCTWQYFGPESEMCSAMAVFWSKQPCNDRPGDPGGCGNLTCTQDAVNNQICWTWSEGICGSTCPPNGVPASENYTETCPENYTLTGINGECVCDLQ